MLYDRHPAAASMATYALKARLAATILRRLQLAAEGEPTLPFSQRDVRGLQQLRALLYASYLGAEVVGATQALALAPPVGHEPDLDEKLESHEVVKLTLPEGKDLADFVPTADRVLTKLTKGNWNALDEDEHEPEFVTGPLTTFLDRLSHASDFVSASGPGTGGYSTLA